MQKSPLGRTARTVNMVQLGKALTELNNPPVKSLFVYNSNPAAVCPDQNLVIRGLKRTDLFTVVHEQFLTDTTDYADIVLPATTFFEHKDLVAAYGHYYLQISDQAIDPLGECKSNVELFCELARRMGFEEQDFGESDDSLIDTALSSSAPQLQGITRERLEREPQVRLNVHGDESPEPWLPFANGFPTASGKALLYNAELIRHGMDPVVEFVPPAESRHTDSFSQFPLELLARKADNFLNSTFVNLPSIQKMERQHELEISRDDAHRRGIGNGDRVRVFNQRGEIYLHAKVDGDLPAGVVGARLGWAKLAAEGVNINVLTSDALTDLGGGATFYSTLVEVERAPETSSSTVG
jgi:anaerobic selenocysteine-containing dehydrogenase